MINVDTGPSEAELQLVEAEAAVEIASSIWRSDPNSATSAALLEAMLALTDVGDIKVGQEEAA